MASKGNASTPCSLMSTNVFSPPVRQADILRRRACSFYATTTNSPEITINCEASAQDYTDLSAHWVKFKVKITKEDGTDLVAEDKVAFVNFALDSMFAKVDCFVNEELITDKADTYPYEAYLTKILNYSKAAKEFQFANRLYAKDQAGKFDDLANTGFTTRAEYTAESNEVELIGRLHVDLFNQPRLLLNKIPLKLVLTQSPARFCLMHAAGKTYKYEITSASLMLSRVTVNPAITNQYETELKKVPAKYPVHHNTIKSFEIPSGVLQVTKETLFSGPKPRRLIVGLVNSTAASGTAAKNPYNFKHFDLSQLKVTFDGSEAYPNEGINVNYDKKQYAEAYEHLLIGTGAVNDDRAIDISPKDFIGGSAIYVIPMTPADPECEAFDPVQVGGVRLEIKFRTATTETIRAIVMAEHEKVYEITHMRNVIKPN